MPNTPPNHPIDFGRHTKITKDEAIALLRSEETFNINKMPFKPKGGELYLIKTKDKNIFDWRETGYRLYQVNGGQWTHTESGGPIKERTANLITPDCPRPGTKEFRMYSFILQDKPNMILIQFVGNSELAVSNYSKRPGRQINHIPAYI